MAKVLIDESTLTSIGDAIREKEGTTDLIPVPDMESRIRNLSTSGGGGGELNMGTCTVNIKLSGFSKANYYVVCEHVKNGAISFTFVCHYTASGDTIPKANVRCGSRIYCGLSGVTGATIEGGGEIIWIGSSTLVYQVSETNGEKIVITATK